MNDPSVDDVVKQIVLANADGEIGSIAVVMIKKNGEPEMQIGMPHGYAYTTIASLEILKNRIIDMIVTNAGKKPKDRN